MVYFGFEAHLNTACVVMCTLRAIKQRHCYTSWVRKYPRQCFVEVRSHEGYNSHLALRGEFLYGKTVKRGQKMQRPQRCTFTEVGTEKSLWIELIRKITDQTFK